MAGIRKASEIRAARKQLRAISSVRRSVFYFMRAILTVLVIGALCILSFLSASRLSNAYILVNEGMPLRAECILKDGSVSDLAVYFTADCIENDAKQRSTSAVPYEGITVSSYEYSLSIKEMHIMPWQASTYVDVVEQIRTVKGSVSAESGAGAIPDWAPRKYRLYLERIDGRWFIGTVELLELNPKLDPPATPDPYQDPLPIVTPSPVPSATPAPTPQ